MTLSSTIRALREIKLTEAKIHERVANLNCRVKRRRVHNLIQADEIRRINDGKGDETNTKYSIEISHEHRVVFEFCVRKGTVDAGQHSRQ